MAQMTISGAIAQTAPSQIRAATSSTEAIALARHLRAIGAKMYGAYWCPHCAEQRRLFGQTAFNLYINYVECAVGGYHAQPEVCKAAKIQAYPTWVIDGKYYVGVHSLEELANLSGYSGAHNF